MIPAPTQASSGILRATLLILALPLSSAGAATAPEPLVMIHGLGGSAASWSGFADALSAQGWLDGGCPTVSGTAVVNDNVNCPEATLTGGGLPDRPFYRVTFSSSSNLTLYEQGQELQKIVTRVLLLNPGKNRVNLVGHSMGGLAARVLVQQLGGASSVSHLITVGTPHLGSPLGPLCAEYPFIPPCPPAGSIALAELDPDSLALATLNNFTTYPLPASVTFTSVVVTGWTVLTTDDTGDGIVSQESQNLTALSSSPSVRTRTVGRLLSEADSCGVSGQLQFHTCETEDAEVQGRILDTLDIILVDDLEIGSLESWTASLADGSLRVTLHQGPPGALAKDIWTTSFYSYDDDGGTPGGGLDDGRLMVGGWADQYFSLLQFDVAGLPNDASSAVLRLYCYGTQGGGTEAFWIDRILEPWDWRLEGTGTDRLRLWWADRPATTPWSTTSLPAPAVGQWYEIDITELYNGWRDGTYPAHGLQLRPTVTNNRWNFFYSSDNTVGSQFNPTLVIVP